MARAQARRETVVAAAGVLRESSGSQNGRAAAEKLEPLRGFGFTIAPGGSDPPAGAEESLNAP